MRNRKGEIAAALVLLSAASALCVKLMKAAGERLDRELQKAEKTEKTDDGSPAGEPETKQERRLPLLFFLFMEGVRRGIRIPASGLRPPRNDRGVPDLSF